jgi:hypothetical protein
MSKKPVAVSLRKPQPAADVEAFVAGPATTAPGRALSPMQGPEAVVRHGTRDYREMTLYLPTDVARQLSFYCMDKNCDVNGVVAEAVTKHVAPAEDEDGAISERAAPEKITLETLLLRSKKKLITLWTHRRRLPRTSV